LLEVAKASQAFQRRRSRIIIPYNEIELLEFEKLKLQTYKLRKQIELLNCNLVPKGELKGIIDLQQ